MLFRLVVLCALIGSPALCSAIKGYSAPESTKGGRLIAPVEQQRLAEVYQTESIQRDHREEQRSEEHTQKLEAPIKGLRAEHREEQQVLAAAPLDGELEKQVVQKTEETKGERTESLKTKLEQRPERFEQQKLVAEPLKQEQVVVRSEEAKGGLRYEARPQVKGEDLRKGAEATKYACTNWPYCGGPPAVRLEPRAEQFEEQQLVQSPIHEQQTEVREEQRRYEDLPLVQPVQPLTVIEEVRSEQLPLAGTKGLVRSQQPLVAPLAETEPYAFSYQVDGSSRTESGDTKGVVRGQYTLQGADGSSRVVDYVADHNGFRASVNTNELGTEQKSPAGVALRTSQPNAEDITLRLEGKTKEELGHTATVKGAPLPPKPEFQIKGAAPRLPLVQLEEVRALPLAKGQRREEELERTHESQTPIKSAELRTPKGLGELKQVAPAQARATFESATAHRDYQRPAQVVYAAPAGQRVLTPPGVVVRAQPPPVLRAPVPAVSRAYLQRERYPPSPVQGYRRQYPVEVPSVVNPRVSFYGPNSANPSSASFDEEQPNSFEHSDS